jgi:UDPglucose--hexose-1-phosphate uridylyltransferase
MIIQAHVERLIQYVIDKRLMPKEDEIYARNKLLDLLHLSYTPITIEPTIDYHLDEILKPILDYAHKQGLIDVDTIARRDIFEAKIMDVLIPRPSEIIRIFKSIKNPIKKTDYLYNLSINSNYIKTNRIKKNIHYSAQTKYGLMEITINLSKPEKDPRDIARSSKKQTSYPSCLLCKENVGYNGENTGVGRTNHRLVPLSLNNETFYLQYSPYVYYDEHCIVLSESHVPMNLGEHTFLRLFDFVDQFPHYFLGSNAGLPIVGGSILSHEHYQGGRYHFPIEQAEVVEERQVENIVVQRLKWPVSVIRIKSKSSKQLTKMATLLMNKWRKYDNEKLGIIHQTKQIHNAITPIARKQGDLFVLDVALRNNRTTKEFPMGLFHPHPNHHHIKKENIGLIEVLGLAVLPGRLAKEWDEIAKALNNSTSLPKQIDYHEKWLAQLKARYNGENAIEFLKRETMDKFTMVLEDAGVFKQTTEGQTAFSAFFNEFIDDYLALD